MKKVFITVVIVMIGIAFTVPIFIPQEVPYLAKLQLILSALITLLLPFTILCLIFAAWVTRHLYIKLERLNIGGVNLLFHKPDKIFKDTAKAFLETKRTLYRIDPELDNFSETLDSYYNTYQFFRKEMSLLDTTKASDKELYEISSAIIKELNIFLTSYQNNFRRWYDYVTDENTIWVEDENGVRELEKKPYMMRIGELQKHYYDYNEITAGFKSVNQFFRSKVNRIIEVDIEKWGSD